MKYFIEEIHYPGNVAENIMPWGERWNYISHTFLNGFINYCEIVKAVLIERYVKFNQKKFNAVLQKENFHPRIGDFGDDVLILAKITDGKYIYFWFDHDVSDCCIGRFMTDDTEAQVLEEFGKHVDDLGYKPHEIPLEYFTHGWKSFLQN